jgi:hypothetical protein
MPPSGEAGRADDEDISDSRPDQGIVDEWQWGIAPFLVRSQAVQTEKDDEWRSTNRRASRRGESPPGYGGTRVIYPVPVEGEVPEETEPVEIPSTYLFSADFEVDNPGEVLAFFLEVQFSGGFVAFINGHEWARHNVESHRTDREPADIIWQPEWVNQVIRGAWRRAYMGLPTTWLREGSNTLSVRVHRRETPRGDRDFHFNAQLRAYTEQGFVKTPYLQQVHQDEITVMWETTTPGVGWVRYGLSPDEMTGLSTSPRVSATLNEVTLTGLETDTAYYYQTVSLLDDGAGGVVHLESDVHRFVTSVDRGTPFTFMLYGDNRTNSDRHAALVEQMIERIETREVRFVMNTGDLTTEANYWDEWQDEFFIPALPMLGDLPLYAALGNHEGNHSSWYEYLSFPNDAMFTLDEAGEQVWLINEGNESWYQFRYGDVDFFALNSSANVALDSAQTSWLIQALSESEAAWQVVFFHHPPYSCVPSRKPGDEAVRTHLVPVFQEHGVDLVLLGHDHLYGRTPPIGGVVYVTSGGGGASTYPAQTDEENLVCIRTHHYAVLDVDAGAIELSAFDLDGEEIDRFRLLPGGVVEELLQSSEPP